MSPAAQPPERVPEQFPVQSSPSLDRIGLEFLAEFLAASCARRPANVDALAELGSVLTRLGRYREGLKVDQRLVRLVPENATVHYNLACSLSLCGECSPALDALERAVALGYDDPLHLEQDPDLVQLRAEPRFRALLARLSEPPTT